MGLKVHHHPIFIANASRLVCVSEARVVTFCPLLPGSPGSPCNTYKFTVNYTVMYLVATKFLFTSNAKAVLNCVKSVQQGKTSFCDYAGCKKSGVLYQFRGKGTKFSPDSNL